MSITQSVQVFESNTAAYHKAFQTFLDHTDQKDQARRWLEAQINALKQKRIFIDAGAGNGKVTAWFTGTFERTIAMEPNPSLREELASVCPRTEILSDTILTARVSDRADFILSSHVFYYVPASEWMENLERLVSWLAPDGTLAVVIQNNGSDCMQMLRRFLNHSFDLKLLQKDFESKHPNDFEISLEEVPSMIQTADRDNAFLIAEFMLNLLPLKAPPAAEEVREYVDRYFKTPQGEYRFSCAQDFLRIRRR